MPAKKRILILGSTGSIGRQALWLAANMPDRFDIVGLVAHSNGELLSEQARQFRPTAIGLIREDCARILRQELGTSPCCVFGGIEGVEQLVTELGADIVLSALLGSAGLRPTLAAIRSGKDIALANKETLVAAGEVVTREVREHGVRLLPVDSEHSALFQCLQGESGDSVRRLILTASGGPFRYTSLAELQEATVEQALSHPTWRMGNKITIDSATLMNKGLEIIEAHWLFAVPVEKIDVLIHPQSVVHSLVELVDGSVKAQMGIPDMRLPILYALFHPERVENVEVPALNLTENSPLTFMEPDISRFPCLRLAREALKAGGTMPAVMNAANEVAVHRFLANDVRFMEIPASIERTMGRHTPIGNPSLEQILEADAWARLEAGS